MSLTGPHLPGLTTEAGWLAFVRGSQSHTEDMHAPLPACPQLPMMTARRLNSGSRLAVNCGLEMLRRHPDVDAIVFSSRHGELERNHRILSELATQTPSHQQISQCLYITQQWGRWPLLPNRSYRHHLSRQGKRVSSRDFMRYRHYCTAVISVCCLSILTVSFPVSIMMCCRTENHFLLMPAR